MMTDHDSSSEADDISVINWYTLIDKIHLYRSRPYREHWDRKLEFVLSCVGYCVGLGNFWRYPYVVYENGGSVFLIPYLCVMLLLTLPLFYLETLLGQFSSSNPKRAFNCVPAFMGIGIAQLFVVLFVAIYYITFLAYSVKYFFASFAFELPWSYCSSSWGADHKCADPFAVEDKLKNLKSCESLKGTNYTFGVDCYDFTWPAEQYWHKAILRDEDGSLSNIGDIHWDLFLMLLLTWVIQYLNLIKGIKTSAKVVYFTATFPFLVLLIMLIYTLKLDGSSEGLKYLFEVKSWSKVLQPTVWQQAITQAFYSIGIGFGSLILYSSYNDFDYPIKKMIFIITFLDIFASILSSMTVFSILGYLAKEVKKDVKDVVKAGPALVFVTMPQAIAQMPVAHLFSVLYFIMLFTVGIDSQAAFVDTFITIIYEEIPIFKNHIGNVRFGCFFILFWLSVPTITKGGFYIVDFLDTFSTGLTLIFLALCETYAIVYAYGIRNFTNDIKFMTGKSINSFWKFCWLIIVPISLTILLFLGFTTSKSCGNLKEGSCTLGWIISLTCMLPVPITFIIVCLKYKLTTGKWELALKPTPNWGPREPLKKIAYLDFIGTIAENEKIMGEHTREVIDKLKEEITGEFPDVRAVATQKAKEKRFSLFNQFSHIFHPGELEQMEQL